MDLFAHSANSSGVKHKLDDHLRSVANLAASFSEKFGAREFGHQIGLWHDLGKAGQEFQRYLDLCEGDRKARGPDHSSAGALIACRSWEYLAFPIGGHHAGLSSPVSLKERIAGKSKDPAIQEAIQTAEKLDLLGSLRPSRMEQSESQISQPERMEVFLRFLLSSLVDADRLDTEQHFEPGPAQIRKRCPPLEVLWDRFLQDQQKITGQKNDLLNQVRHEIFLACLQAAEMPPGVFRLTVPTGGGKTRSGIAFALKHALKHGLDRVIVAIPYTSIIEQTTDIYRAIFGRDAVLEHHSAANVLDDAESPTREETRLLLATENWDLPIIVTTQVQLFESLFSHRPGACRKLHNMARSVILLDEVQTLPVSLLGPVLDMLQTLADYYGVTVVLCTATQPAFTDPDSPYLKGFRDTKEIVTRPERYFQALKRVRYEVPGASEDWTWEQLAHEMRNHEQGLAVVNTKRDASSLLTALNDPSALYLSTSLCGAHRREVLERVREKLAAGEPCRLVSTQVVEAGVDLDFPVVFRALGPLDRIVQAAGRCNREGKLREGRVVIFKPKDGHIPGGEYRSGAEEAKELLQEESVDLHDPFIYERYFRRLYQGVDTDRWKIQELRRRLDFPQVAERFRLIPDETLPAVVRFNREAEQWIGELRSQKLITQDSMRHLQPYLVNVYRHRLAEMEKSGLICPLVPGIALYEWCGGYDPVLGIVESARNPDAFVV